jgi:4-alpha-glucanotransferase
MGLQGENDVWGVIRAAHSSVSQLCIVPMQDYLELGGETRMNFPGTTGTNWTWRALDGFADETLAKRIAAVTRLYYRAKQ